MERVHEFMIMKNTWFGKIFFLNHVFFISNGAECGIIKSKLLFYHGVRPWKGNFILCLVWVWI